MSHKCTLCKKSYVWPNDLRRHTKVIHNTQEQLNILKSQQQEQQQQQQQQLSQPYYDDPKQQQEQQQLLQPYCDDLKQQEQQEQQQQQQLSRPYYEDHKQQQQEEEQQQQHRRPVYHLSKLNEFKFKHPFTALFTGPTSCGKTYLVKEILQRKLIEPQSDRIIWLYKRWQPLYDVIERTVQPPVEFIQGIPIDLENDSFINPKLRNLIIIDDLMSSLAKDSRFNELFTEGSHHRNLSVLAISQNLYFSKDPTQRRNCHYLVLFKNPVDKQQIMTLARQMYPRKSQIFMDKFDKATMKERGFLLVDLKPTTSENNRLRENIFTTVTNSTDKVNDRELEEKRTAAFLSPLENTSKTTAVLLNPAVINAFKTPVVSPNYQIQENTWAERMSEKPTVATQTAVTPTYQEYESMPSCDDCGLVFDNFSDVQRHVKNWCTDFRSNKRKSEQMGGRLSKIAKVSSSQVWAKLIGGQVFRDNAKVQAAMKSYTQDDYSQSETRRKAIRDYLPELSKDFRKAYVELLINVDKLNHDPVHLEIMKTAQRFETDFDMKKFEAIQQAVKLRKSLLNDMIETLTRSQDDDGDNDDHDDETDDMSDDNDDETDEVSDVESETEED